MKKMRTTATHKTRLFSSGNNSDDDDDERFFCSLVCSDCACLEILANYDYDYSTAMHPKPDSRLFKSKLVASHNRRELSSIRAEQTETTTTWALLVNFKSKLFFISSPDHFWLLNNTFFYGMKPKNLFFLIDTKPSTGKASIDIFFWIHDPCRCVGERQMGKLFLLC